MKEIGKYNCSYNGIVSSLVKYCSETGVDLERRCFSFLFPLNVFGGQTQQISQKPFDIRLYNFLFN